MFNSKLISVIIRTKNEEQWIGHCLKKIFSQKKVNIEVILVDNLSNDKTLDIAKKFPIKIIKIKNFKPGKAINLGVKKSKGEIIVCLSAHCIPCDDYWLKNLTRNLNNKKVAGIYGRQIPLPYTSDLDKRDLLNTFGLDKKIQRKDSFFHNANSAFLKSNWKKVNFDENITNIEDRVWAHKFISMGYKLIYEPKASVYHWHGIHQDMDIERCSNIVRILESLGNNFRSKHFKNINDMKVILLIPQRGSFKEYNGKSLIEHTISSGRESKYIKKIFVYSDNKKVSLISQKLNCLAPFLRPKQLSENHVDLLSVARFFLQQLEKKNFFIDYVIVATEIFPKRENRLFDNLIKEIFNKNYDAVFPIKSEKSTILKFDLKNTKFEFITNGFKPSDMREEKIYLSRPGYGFVIRPDVLRSGNINYNNVGFYRVKKPHFMNEIEN